MKTKTIVLSVASEYFVSSVIGCYVANVVYYLFLFI